MIHNFLLIARDAFAPTQNGIPTGNIFNVAVLHVYIPSGTSAVLCDSGDENIEDFCENEGSFEQSPDSEACQRWHEAAFILKVKEQYVVSQAVIDHLLPATKELVYNNYS